MSLFRWKNEQEIVNRTEQMLGSAERVVVYTMIYLFVGGLILNALWSGFEFFSSQDEPKTKGTQQVRDLSEQPQSDITQPNSPSVTTRQFAEPAGVRTRTAVGEEAESSKPVTVGGIRVPAAQAKVMGKGSSN
jgi:hypothetical protein